MDGCHLHGTKSPAIREILKIVEALTASNSTEKKSLFLTRFNEHNVDAIAIVFII